jgi:hypothetical protein
MPSTPISLHSHNNAGHLLWQDAHANQYTSVDQSVNSRLYHSTSMKFAGTLDLHTTATVHQYYLNTSCSNCAGNCRCSDCRTQEDMETDGSMWANIKEKAVAAGKQAKAAYHSAKDTVGKSIETAKNNIEKVKSAAKAAKEAFDNHKGADHADDKQRSNSLANVHALVQQAENDLSKEEAGLKALEDDLAKMPTEDLSTEAQESLTKSRQEIEQLKKLLKDLKDHIGTIGS